MMMLLCSVQGVEQHQGVGETNSFSCTCERTYLLLSSSYIFAPDERYGWQEDNHFHNAKQTQGKSCYDHPNHPMHRYLIPTFLSMSVFVCLCPLVVDDASAFFWCNSRPIG
jgi:hypothetical protein